jgi:iron complex outermembrane receptor protein
LWNSELPPKQWFVHNDDHTLEPASLGVSTSRDTEMKRENETMGDPVRSQKYRPTLHGSTRGLGVRTVLPLVLLPAILALAPDLAAAQAAAASPQANAGSVELEEVIVTARRREERLMDVPSSIAAFSEQTIKDADLTKIDDLNALAPNLNMNTRSDFTPNVTLRGVGSFGVVEGVGFYVNDVKQFEGEALPFEDIEQIQVLRGPQGTLYGGSNIGGAIKYTTKRPTDELTGDVKLEGGEWKTRNVSAVLSGPIIPGTLGARLTVFDNRKDGFIYDTKNNQTVGNSRITGGRLTLEYDQDQTRALIYLTSSTETEGTFIPFYQAPNDHTYLRTTAYGDQPPIYMDRDVSSAVVQIDQTFNHLTLTSLSSAFRSTQSLRADLDFGSAPPLLYTDVRQAHDVYAEELRLASPADQKFSWLTGVFFQNRADPNSSNFHIVPPDLVFPTVEYPHGHLYALFINAIYKSGPWALEAGLRAERDDNRLRVVDAGPEQSQITQALLPRVSVSYALQEHLNGYAAVTRGFTPGNLTFVNAPVAAIEKYERETAVNYELGLKGTALDGRLRFEGDVFYVPYSNRLFQTNIVFPGLGFVQVTNNVGDSKNYGIEASADARLAEEWTLSAGLGVTKAKWGNAVINDANTGTPLNLNGLTAPYAPAYQASVGLDWAHPLTRSVTLGARVDASAIGKQYWDLDDFRQQRAYQLVNLSTRLDSGRWELSAHVTNLFDRRFNVEYYTAAEVGAATDIAAVAQPRIWTVALTARF